MPSRDEEHDPTEPHPEEHDPKDPRAMNPFYRGARLSEVARAVASPTDPEVRKRLRRKGTAG
ncbi:hypothetical protein [Candidatus Palauibacter sp.]|uniref:hypothetical protein n=1 Tax=Candidatus Palauibacter sp. TaxID=3101350 RepID=UPI003B01BCA0